MIDCMPSIASLNVNNPMFLKSPIIKSCLLHILWPPCAMQKEK